MKNTLHLNWLSFFTELLSTLFFIATFIATSIFVGRGVVKQIYTMGFFSMVFSLLVKLFTTIKQFTMFILNKSEYIKFLEAYYDVLELPIAENQHELLYISNEKPLPVIRLDEIKYQYPQAAQEAINGISTEFYEGEKIAVVGLNGSGKSTLMSIILSLFQNYSGRYSLSSVAVFSAVLQDFAQYQMSVKENIEIGCGGKSLPDAKIQSILQSVGLWGVVQSLPQGIHTQLGQLKNGIELSKGQWQRLALGRLLANEEANVWILDEPTAFLDPLAEIDIYKLMFKLSGTRTVFFISHRLGFASSADRIIVVHEGKITENGKHSELMKNGNLYAKMFDSQKEWYL